MRKQRLLSALAVAVVVAAITGGVFALRATSQEKSDIVLNPENIGPDPVTVNGEPLSGKFVAIYEANGGSRAAAINLGIEQILMVQAARRLGLEATDEEAAEYVRGLEASWDKLSEEQRREVHAVLIDQGLPTSNIAANADVLEYGHLAKTTINMRNFLLERLAVAELTGVPPDTIADAQQLARASDGLDLEAITAAKRRLVVEQRFEPEVARFIQQERDAADIVPVAQ